MKEVKEQIRFVQDFSGIKQYYKEIRKIKVLDGDEQIELVKKAKKGDKQAFDSLISTNLRFVVSVAKDYRYSGLSLEDLISEGNLGLMEAVHRFDETKGFKFISYAVWWIRQALIKAVQDHGKNIRMPLNKINSISKIKKAKGLLYQKLNREPTDDELLEVLDDVSESDIKSFNINGNIEISIDEPLTEDSDYGYQDFLAGDSYEDFEKQVNLNALKNEIGELLKELSQRELVILTMFYGLDGEEPFTLKDIGEKLNLTNERVRQIKEESLRKLRVFDKSYALKEFLDTRG